MRGRVFLAPQVEIDDGEHGGEERETRIEIMVLLKAHGGVGRGGNYSHSDAQSGSVKPFG